MASPVSYQIGGEQYIAVAVGAGGAFGRMMDTLVAPRATNPSRVLVFKLGGGDSLPVLQEQLVKLPDLSHLELDEVKAEQGSGLYIRHCLSCHGVAAVGNRITPDLRNSGFIQSAVAWQKSFNRQGTCSAGYGQFC
jgi:quinohemoprotein ethanol dehydrogenase